MSFFVKSKTPNEKFIFLFHCAYIRCVFIIRFRILYCRCGTWFYHSKHRCHSNTITIYSLLCQWIFRGKVRLGPMFIRASIVKRFVCICQSPLLSGANEWRNYSQTSKTNFYRIFTIFMHWHANVRILIGIWNKMWRILCNQQYRDNRNDYQIILKMETGQLNGNK